MFINCPNCNALVATDLATDQPPERCPRCGHVLREAASPAANAATAPVPATADVAPRFVPLRARPGAASEPPGHGHGHGLVAFPQPPPDTARPTDVPTAPSVTPASLPAGTSTLAPDAMPPPAAPPALAASPMPAAPPAAQRSASAPAPASPPAKPAPAGSPDSESVPAPLGPHPAGPPVAHAHPADATASPPDAAPAPPPVAAAKHAPGPATPATAAPRFLRPPATAVVPAARERRALWIALPALALLFGLQLLLADRDRLAADPTWRPWVAAACTLARCELPAWHEPDAIALVQREVRPHPERPGVLLVDATLRNEARHPQAWPMLALTLSDVDGRALGARWFAPGEYRPDDAPARLAPGAQATFRLEVVEPSPHTVAFNFEFG